MDSRGVEKTVVLARRQAPTPTLSSSEPPGRSLQKLPRIARSYGAPRLRNGRQAKTSVHEVVAGGGTSSAAVEDLYDFPAPSGRLLQECFHLTPAETRLACIIARGEPLECAAQTLGIKLPTARTQLAAIFAKTNTRRQPQLVALLSRLAHLCPL